MNWRRFLGIVVAVLLSMSVQAEEHFEQESSFDQIAIDLSKLRPAAELEKEILQTMDREGGMDLGLNFHGTSVFGDKGFDSFGVSEQASSVATDKVEQVICVAQSSENELSYGWSKWPTDADRLALNECNQQGCFSLGCMVRK